MGLVDQQDRVRTRKQNARFELQGLWLRLLELGDTAFSGTVKSRLAADVLIELTVSGLSSD